MKEKRAITMDDIARLAEVSKPTVSRALNGSPLVKQDTMNRVLAVANRYGYAVNRHAQKLRRKRTNTIAVSLDFGSHHQGHIADPFMFELLSGVSEALGDLNQDLLLCAPNHNDSEAFRNIFWSRGADGLIVLGQGHREDMLHEFAATGSPLVVWGASARSANYCVVGSDNYLGGQLAGRHLIRRKRRHWLYVGDTSFRELRLRFDGLTQVARDYPHPIEIDNIELHSFSYEAASEAAKRYLSAADRCPDGVFAFNDTAAMAFISAFQAAGVRIPEDVSVVGYNDIPTAAYFTPNLTTIRQDCHQAGRVLVRKLMRVLDGHKPKSALIKTELILRET